MIKKKLSQIRYEIPTSKDTAPRKSLKQEDDQTKTQPGQSGDGSAKPKRKPKKSLEEKLSFFGEQMRRKDSVTPQLFHLLERFFRKEKCGNEFERTMFDELSGFSAKELESLEKSTEVFKRISSRNKKNLFVPEYLDWEPDQPVDADVLLWNLIDNGMASVTGKGINQMFQTGKVRVWGKFDFGDGTTVVTTAPWPWINEVNGLRTATHRQPLDLYRPDELQQSCNWGVNPDTGDVENPVCVQATPPNCEIANHIDKNNNCLSVPTVRVGNRVELVGFNYFSFGTKIKLMSADGSISEYEAAEVGDEITPIYDSNNIVIADHRVRDILYFNIPTKTPDGLYEFAPGIYTIIVQVPNDIGYTMADGTQPAFFESNSAFIKILPKEEVRYRIWSDMTHCYRETSEVGSDEIYVESIAGMWGTPNVPGSARVNDVDTGEPHNWNWPIYGTPGDPQPVNGLLVIGIIGWEVDSESALEETVRSWGQAFAKFWEKIWEKIVALAAVVGSVVAALLKLAWWQGLVITGSILLVTTIVGMIWAGWAPPERIIFDLMTFTEEQLYFLTYPTSPLPGYSDHALIPDINVQTFPQSRTGYMYTEERQYRCVSELCSNGIKYHFKRDV